ncbi:MAG: hypothetical protein AB7F59_11070 [Bdellovibrionales bacterium]
MKTIIISFLTAMIGLSASTSHGTEPAYCNKAFFMQKKIKYKESGLERWSAFKLGRITLAGVGIGNSDSTSVAKAAEALGQVPSSDKYCSWYLNDGNTDAERLFSAIYVSNPRGSTPQKVAKEYIQKLGSSFADAPINFMYCMEKYNYVAVGCNGNRHRGPTVFGMILSYSGCRPESAADIVNTLWGLNGVPEENRLGAIQAAHNLGVQTPAESLKMRQMFEQ